MIWLAATTLVVFRTTSARTTIAGPSCDGTDLRDWMVNPEGFTEQVQAFCKSTVNLYENGSSGIPVVQIECVKLQPPIAMSAQIEYLTDVTLSMGDERFTSYDANCFLIMRAPLTNISQR